MKQTPLQIVNEKFGSREELAGQLASMVDRMHGDDSESAVKSRLMGLSNPKLLRLYKVEQRVREQFGDKEKLIDHLIETRREAGHTADEAYKEKLLTYTKARLLDMTRQKYDPKPEKQTAEAKEKRKRGKKAKAS